MGRSQGYTTSNSTPQGRLRGGAPRGPHRAHRCQDPSTGCYMYYFQYLSKTYCVDTTRETNHLGRLINHSKCGNCQTKLHDSDWVPHLILIASATSPQYDYGDHSKAYPWLKH
ncbi:N-lysine methyltransferase SETD8 [Fukomys damarensis]|uniref:N-lysine methyltransferase SETD8 n=1 Tax=Fukomys damarensis TaxID=885580 RepID=A0A091CUS4_FUKDA|nr:N-lysine methyltransferase SETD8 [Fukomys damarensis]